MSSVVASVALGLTLFGCGGSSGSNTAASSSTSARSSSAASSGASSVASSSASSAATTSAAAAPQGTSTVHSTGSMAIDVSGPGGSCAYYFPGEQRGVSYHVSSTEFPGSGSWDLNIQGDPANTAGVLLNTQSTSYGNDAQTGNGTVNAAADLHHADVDLDLVNIVNHSDVIHLTATIDCA